MYILYSIFFFVEDRDDGKNIIELLHKNEEFSTIEKDLKTINGC